MVQATAASAKTLLRASLRGLRRTLAHETPDAAERAAALLPDERLAGAVVAAGYCRQGFEMDAFPVMGRLAEAGARLCLPAGDGEDVALAFRAFDFGDPLAPDAHGVPAPLPAADLLHPDLVVAPLLAFDRAGGRIGQGGGHYDRTIAALRARGPVFVIGLAFAGQEVAQLPHEPHDQRLDAILTETAYIEVRKDP